MNFCKTWNTWSGFSLSLDRTVWSAVSGSECQISHHQAVAPPPFLRFVDLTQSSSAHLELVFVSVVWLRIGIACWASNLCRCRPRLCRQFQPVFISLNVKKWDQIVTALLDNNWFHSALLPTRPRSVGVGSMLGSVCLCLSVCLSVLFVRSITQKRIQFKLGIGNDLGYPRNDVVLGLKGQRHGAIKCIFQTHTYNRASSTFAR